MCRQIAICPGTTRAEALDILQDMQGGNKDGIGSVYLNSNNKFVIEKYPESLSEILLKKKTFLNCLPHKGWVLVHERAASCGSVNYFNSHPFVVGEWAACHNGTMISDSKLIKLCIGDKCTIKGTTDSEIAINLINIIGPEKFTEGISYGGVFLCLNRDGSLHVAKTSGDMVRDPRENETWLLSSELDRQCYPDQKYIQNGYYKYNAEGKLIKEIIKPSTTSYHESWKYDNDKDDNVEYFGHYQPKNPINHTTYPASSPGLLPKAPHVSQSQLPIPTSFTKVYGPAKALLSESNNENPEILDQKKDLNTCVEDGKKFYRGVDRTGLDEGIDDFDDIKEEIPNNQTIIHISEKQEPPINNKDTGNESGDSMFVAPWVDSESWD